MFYNPVACWSALGPEVNRINKVKVIESRVELMHVTHIHANLMLAQFRYLTNTIQTVFGERQRVWLYFWLTPVVSILKT